jgi:hypothetical protein
MSGIAMADASIVVCTAMETSPNRQDQASEPAVKLS